MTSQEQFWKWFVQHESKLFNLDLDNKAEREYLFDSLAGELQKVDSDLSFEFGPREQPREFIISASGLKRAFPAVTSLIDAMPVLDQWQVIAFRPRRSLTNTVEFRNKRVDPKEVQFTLLDNGKFAGIYLFIPEYSDDDADFKQLGYLILDEALGEYDVESRVGLIKMFRPDVVTNGERHPLSHLPTFFDQLVTRLEGRSGKVY